MALVKNSIVLVKLELVTHVLGKREIKQNKLLQKLKCVMLRKLNYKMYDVKFLIPL